jgi:hypothetical protein
MPVFSIGVGLLMLAAFWIGDSLTAGLGALGVMTAAGLLFAVGGRRSETLSGLAGPGRDERWERIDVYATALTGSVLIAVILGAWLWEIAHGRDGEPYGQLAALAGVVYIASVALLRWRS